MPGVKRERSDAVGVLTLDEPASLNAMTPDLLGDLATAVRDMTDDPQGAGCDAPPDRRQRTRDLCRPVPS